MKQFPHKNKQTIKISLLKKINKQTKQKAWDIQKFKNDLIIPTFYDIILMNDKPDINTMRQDNHKSLSFTDLRNRENLSK